MNKNLKDLWNLSSKATVPRLWNLIRLRSSFFGALWTRKAWHNALPSSISIEPTTSCNLRCPQCPSGLRAFSRPTGMLQMDLFKKVVDELAPHTWYLTLYFQGEPFLNPNFLEFVSYAHQKKLYTATSTNAHHITSNLAKCIVESGLDRLIISLDGITQETYKTYRIGGQLTKVLEGTAHLLYWKKVLKSSTPHVIWQFIAFKHNEHQIPDLKRLSKEMGVDELAIKTAQIYDTENAADWIPENPELSRYQEVSANGYVIQNKLRNQCWRMWRSAVITWDGKVVPCCFDKDAKYQLGDLSHQSFREIWKSKPYQNFRMKLLKGRSEIDICTNCSEGTKIWN